MNRKDNIKDEIYDETYDRYKKMDKIFFDFYVKKRWHYIGGNFDNHLLYFNSYKRGTFDITDINVCYMCEKDMSIKDKIFYITDGKKNKGIGKCCIEKFQECTNFFLFNNKPNIYNPNTKFKIE